MEQQQTGQIQQSTDKQEEDPRDESSARRDAAEKEFEELCALFTEDTLPMLSGDYFEDIHELSVIDDQRYALYCFQFV